MIAAIRRWLVAKLQPPASEEPTVVFAASTETPTLDELKWQQRLDDVRFNALPHIRAAAEKWLTTISTVTGVFGIFALIKGRDDFTKLRHSYEVAVGLSLLAATLFALVAIFAAALAAEGTATREVLNALTIRRRFNDAAAAAASQLRASRRLTILAVAFVALAIGITWYGPQNETTTYQRITLKGDGVHPQKCGTVELQDNGLLAVTPPDGDAPLTDVFETSEIEKVETVKKC